MFSIARPNRESPIYQEYLALIANEWPDAAKNDEFNNVPTPVLLLEQSRLIGGLTFSRYPAPATGIEALWINSLYIKPEFRGEQLAALLMAEVDNLSRQFPNGMIYVYTSIPEFYLKLGWVMLETNGKFSVLEKTPNQPTDRQR